MLLTACQPFAVISVNAEDGGSPAHPKVLYTGEAAKFVHSARWPREGGDKFVLTGGEENFTGRCERNNSEFSVYSAEQVLDGASTQFEGPLAQVPPAGNGVYADGKPVAGALGCSVHWFQEHATFRNGGLVAISEYEDGVRFLQIEPDGADRPSRATSSRSAARRRRRSGPARTTSCTRSTTSAASTSCAGRASTTCPAQGAGAGRASAAPTASRRRRRRRAAQAAQRDALAAQLRATGWSPLVCSLVARGD